ncbi:MAG: helicase-related protein [Patescibacteria group bacterium]
MNKVLDNKKSKVSDVLLAEIKDKAKLSVISAYFTIYAFEKLKKSLSKIDSLRFLFVEPTFTKEQEETREFYIDKLDREKQLSGTQYEIKLRNELTQSKVAKECADWIRSKVDFRSLKKSDLSRARAIHVQNPDSEFIVQGTLDFTSSGLGFSNSNKLEMNVYSDDQDATREMLTWFDEIWNDEMLVEDVKEEVLKSIQTIYKENTPEFIYYVTLYNLFKEYLDELTEENIIKVKTGVKDSIIWKKLFKFQKDGVMGVIDKLEKHNGCILADSVGLGKTFEGLAVIKYYELRNYRVLVLCPKKLRDNWMMYRSNDVRNIFAEDRFGYDILNHTDLSREKGMSGDINLETINWGNYDLVLIDESHNFRNNDSLKNKKTRYRKLMDDIIRTGVKTKVLMLSATPVNNRMNDLKNQIAFITEGNDEALLDEGVKNIGNTFRLAQYQFNKWLDRPLNDRGLDSLLASLNVDYFKLLDALTIARSRKHIEKYYDLSEVGRFPDRLKPLNIKSKVDLKGDFPSFEDINDSIKRLSMAIYSPLQYVRSDRVKKYQKKYDREVKGGSYFRQTDREKNIVNLMRVNILKRLESSIFSYNLTLTRLAGKIEEILQMIDDFHDSGRYSLDLDDAPESIDGDDEQLESMTVGNKISVELADMDLIRWKDDLQSDLTRLKDLISFAEPINTDSDAKLADLKKIIADKISNPINDNNKKVVVFSAFSDTAEYLYKYISEWLENKFNLHSALVTGGTTNKTTSDEIKTDLNSILTNFSPVSKEKAKVFPGVKDEIDVLIATDCVSEGQNLQDCDYLINYDIHWNPVRIIQRFGRIDRIGSVNEKIQLVNFWPDMELDEYINLEQRVRGRMILLNASATGEEDIINETDKDVMNDIEYRKNQLTRLQEEVLDLEDISGNISITDMTMSDFKMDLMEYLKDNRELLERSALGMYAIVSKDESLEDLSSGVIFTLRQVDFSEAKSGETNAIHPYYMVYIGDNGEVKLTYLQAKYVLDIFKKLCNGNNLVHRDLVELFDKETQEAKDMSKYSDLLRQSIEHIIGEKQEKGIEDIFSSLGKTNIAKDASLSWIDDFELISFLIIK